MKSFFRSSRCGAAKARVERFEHAINLARDITKIDAGGLVALTRLVAAPLQARAIGSAVSSAPPEARRTNNLDTLFFGWGQSVTPQGQTAYELAPRVPNSGFQLRLGVDPVLAAPWVRARLADALSTIGFGKRQGAWSEDSNHRVTLLLPMGIGLVNGGNHSIAAGIVNGEGHVTSTDVQDLAPLYDHVHYNGLAFVRTWDGLELSQPEDEEPGLLFEIGRLMAEHKVHSGVGRAASDAVAALSCSDGDDFYYKVFINGQEARVGLTRSGAALFLRHAGLEQDGAAWRAATRGETLLRRSNRNGEQESIQLRWSSRRQVVNDLRFVYAAPPLVENDDD